MRGISLPGFDRPKFTAKGLQIFLSDPCFSQIIISRGFIEIGIPRHPSGWNLRAPRTVYGMVIRNIPVFIIVQVKVECENLFG